MSGGKGQAHPPSRGTGIALAAAAAAGIAALAAFSWADWPRWAGHERFEQPTAVEDRTFFQVPDRWEAGREMARAGGTAWLAADAELLKIRDSQLLADTPLAPGGPVLYRSERPEHRDVRFLKIEVDKYLVVRAAAAQPE